MGVALILQLILRSSYVHTVKPFMQVSPVCSEIANWRWASPKSSKVSPKLFHRKWNIKFSCGVIKIFNNYKITKGVKRLLVQGQIKLIIILTLS